MLQLYKFYFELEPILIVPKSINSDLGDLEYIEQLNVKSNNVVIFGYADILFSDLIKINKRRLNCLIRSCAKKCKVIILSITNLKILKLTSLELFSKYNLPSKTSFKTIPISLFDFDDPDSFAEMVEEFKDRRVYISLSLPISQIKEIESKLKENGLVVHRKEQENGIVLNASKTTERTFLKNDYDIYIFILPNDIEQYDLLYYFKDILTEKTQEIYIESNSNDFVEQYLQDIYKDRIEIPIIKDLKDEHDSLKAHKALENAIYASENWYRFDAPPNIVDMDLKNLNKKDYDIIRNFVLTKLKCKFDLEVKTCQLSTPCSPKDRSKKLNSLSNKISSIDYRCDVTCEIFKDYTIGVVIWSDTFASKEKIPYLKNEVYVYQTTSGKWKVTEIC